VSHSPALEAAVPSALSRCVAVDAGTFAAEHWSRRPALSRAKELPAPFADLLSVDDVDELVAERAVRTPFFRTVRQGEGVTTPVRAVTAGGRRLADVVDPDALHRQHADGATLVLNALHRSHPPVGRFCRQLATELGHPTQCNAYVTPGGGAQGFDFHHDTHDVFVLQVSGRKRWIVHEPVLRLPLPSQARSGADLVAAGAEPLLDVDLEAGDALYLPRGYVHAAVTTDEHSVHLTVGVLSTTWHDVLADAVALAAAEERFRDALPVDPASALDDLPAFLRAAADWLAVLPADAVRERVERRLARAVPVEPVRLLAQAAAVRDLEPATRLRPRAGLRPVVEDGDGVVTVRLPDRVVTLPAFAAPALRRLLERPCAPTDLVPLGLDEPGALVLARRLLREGVLVPAVAGAQDG
jgi:bifunctional lysine-specific demethylase and histidyl-hydroxylase NO66